MDRESFMLRIREALEVGQTTPPREQAPAVDEALARLASSDDPLVTMFAERAEAVGMHVHRCPASELTQRLIALLREVGARRIATSVGSIPQALGLNESLRRAGFELVDWKKQPGFEAQYELDAGITDVHAAFAETGTLVCSSDAGHSRGLSLVPPTHIALVRETDILPDMIDYWPRLRGLSGADLPSSQAFITGPSKTADIEGVLIQGVHGPERVEIMIVGDGGEA